MKFEKWFICNFHHSSKLQEPLLEHETNNNAFTLHVTRFISTLRGFSSLVFLCHH